MSIRLSRYDQSTSRANNRAIVRALVTQRERGKTRDDHRLTRVKIIELPRGGRPTLPPHRALLAGRLAFRATISELLRAVCFS